MKAVRKYAIIIICALQIVVPNGLHADPFGAILAGSIAIAVPQAVIAYIRYKYAWSLIQKKSERYINRDTKKLFSSPDIVCSVCHGKKNKSSSHHTYCVKPVELPLSVQKSLRYNPQVRYIKESCPEVVYKKNHPTIYLHGLSFPFGQVGSHDALFMKDSIPGDVITFNFPDRYVGKYDISSDYQWGEILPVIAVLNYVARDHIHAKAVDFWGHSRGADVLINVLGVLSTDDPMYKKQLQSIGISDEDRMAIVRLIKKGVHTISSPGMFRESHSLTDHIFNTVTQFAPKSDLHPCFMVKKIDPGFVTMVQLQTNDPMTKNKHDKILLSSLIEKNNVGTYTHIAHDFKHTLSTSFLKDTHRIRKKHGAAYHRRIALTSPHVMRQIPLDTLQETVNNMHESNIRNFYKEHWADSTSDAIIAHDTSLRSKPTWSKPAHYLHKKKWVFGVQKYFFNDHRILCRFCQNVIASYDNLSDEKQNKKILFQIMKKLSNKEHVCFSQQGKLFSHLSKKN